MTDEAQKPASSKSKSRKGGKDKVWKVVQEYLDEKSSIGIRITKRTKGAPAFNWQIVKINENGPATPHIPEPCFGAEHAVEDIVFSLVKAAREYIAAELEKLGDAKTPKPKGNGKGKGGGKPRDRDGKGQATGLSQLAKKDAEAAGHKYVSKADKRKAKRKQAQQG